MKQLKWQSYQTSKTGPDTGTIVMQAHPKGAKSPYVVEFGWYLLKKINEKPRLIRNTKHDISVNFPIEADPENPVTLPEFVEWLPWRETVAKVLPPDAFEAEVSSVQ